MVFDKVGITGFFTKDLQVSVSTLPVCLMNILFLACTDDDSSEYEEQDQQQHDTLLDAHQQPGQQLHTHQHHSCCTQSPSGIDILDQDSQGDFEDANKDPEHEPQSQHSALQDQDPNASPFSQPSGSPLPVSQQPSEHEDEMQDSDAEDPDAAAERFIISDGSDLSDDEEGFDVPVEDFEVPPEKPYEKLINKAACWSLCESEGETTPKNVIFRAALLCLCSLININIA